MSKHRYTQEFELNATPKAVYPYLHSPNSLAEWFASKVEVDNQKIFNFVWDNTDHFAKIVTSRTNKQIKFEFLDESKKPIEDSAYIEFKLLNSELTNATFLRVTDYSEMTNENDLNDLWQGLINQLKEVMAA